MLRAEENLRTAWRWRQGLCLCEPIPFQFPHEGWGAVKGGSSFPKSHSSSGSGETWHNLASLSCLCSSRLGSFTFCPFALAGQPGLAWPSPAEACRGLGTWSGFRDTVDNDESPGAGGPVGRLEEAGLFCPGSGRAQGQRPWLMQSARCWPAVLCLPEGPAGPKVSPQQEGVREDRKKDWL